MPELPEVETIVRDIRPSLLGRRFMRAALSHDDVLRGVSRRRLLKQLKGAAVRDVFRRAKHAVIDLGTHRLVVQPGMTGSLVVYDAPLPPSDSRYAVLRITLDDGHELIYDDVRRLGTLLLLDAPAWGRYTAAIGPEPLDPAYTSADLGSALSGSRQAIKKVIMDQRYVAGVGNIYANEALFAAGIDPSRPANRLTPDEHVRLHWRFAGSCAPPSNPRAAPCATTAPAPAFREISSSSCSSTSGRASPAPAAGRNWWARTR